MPRKAATPCSRVPRRAPLAVVTVTGTEVEVSTASSVPADHRRRNGDHPSHRAKAAFARSTFADAAFVLRMFPNGPAPAGRRASVRAVHGRTGRTVLVGLLLAVTAACSRPVAGTPTAGPSSVAASPTAVGPAPGTRTIALVPDVVRNECLLDAAQFGALLGRPVRPPQQSVVRRDDGSRTAGCAVSSTDRSRAPLGTINVYRVRSGTAAEFVRGSSGRAVPGAGETAAVLDTASGPTLQVARGPFLVTLVVAGRAPDDDAWRAAATAALAQLPQ